MDEKALVEIAEKLRKIKSNSRDDSRREKHMANDSQSFWAVFEEAKEAVRKWPDWKQQIQVGIYSEAPQVVCPPVDDDTDERSEK
ncbi:MAG TPA: hypothetical protein VGQ65_16850 [Thermoanaerobaculia bacterium]|nr:hypothetical protein [Thermoanaerobaculia bacterium]